MAGNKLNFTTLAILGAGAYLLTKKADPKVAGIGDIMVPNFHVLQVRYLGATNYLPGRVKIISERFRQSKTIDFGNEPGSNNPTIETAVNYLTGRGFNIIGKGEGKDCYYIISTTFESL